MTIKQYGGVFGRNPTFNNVTIEGTLTFDGDIDINSDLTISGNLYLPDNSKAIFGTGSDLQIYHDGLNSYITDNGTGDLIVTSPTAYRVRTDQFQINNAANTAELIQAVAGGAVKLRHNGSLKLATTASGVSVTGTVTADGLAVSTGVYSINTSGASLISSTGSVKIDIDSDNNANDNRFLITSDGNTKNRLEVKESGNISFYNAAGDSQALFWDASASALGLGTTTVNADLHLGAASPHIDIGPSTGNRGKIGYNTNNVYIGSTSGTGEIHFKNNIGSTDAPNASGDTKMVIADAGVSIGTTTVNSKLNVASSQDALKYNEGVTVFRSTGSNKMFLNCVGGGANIVGSNSPITFNYHDQTTNSVTEAMRIVSGNLLVGKTTNSVDIVGGIIRADGLVNGCSDSNYSAIFSRNTNDGDIVLFRKDGTTVGSIGTGGGNLNIGNGTANLRFTSGSISPSGTTAGGSSDGVTDLGLSSRRFKDLHLSGGVVFGTTGGSVSSKTLDDYEEGTWTPTLYYQNATGVTRTYTEQTGHYTKIGNTVTVWCTLKGGTSNSGSYANDNMGISGLPFSVTTSATMPLRQSGFAGTASVGTLCMQVTSSVALLATPENLNNLGEDLGAGATYALSFSGSYETTA